MTKKFATIVFFGNERLATGVTTSCPTLQALIDAGYHIAAVVVNEAGSTSRNQREQEVQKLAESHKIPVIVASSWSEITPKLRQHKAVVGVLAAFGKIVPESIIKIFPKGIVNIHPSLLPLHRGPTPIESAMLQAETKTGVSIMSLVKAMDAGPVFGQAELQMNGSEQKQELVDELGNLGAAMLVELLPGIISGEVTPLPQDDAQATYDQLIDKKAAEIDWKKAAERLEREIRAYAGWPGSKTTLANKEVIVTKAHAVDEKGTLGKATHRDKELLVGCGKGSLVIEKLKPAGKREMTGKEFLAGNRL